jgi:hypothetical protein
MRKFLAIDTNFSHKPNSPVQCYSGDLSLQSPYTFGIAFFEVITTGSVQHRFIQLPAFGQNSVIDRNEILAITKLF